MCGVVGILLAEGVEEGFALKLSLELLANSRNRGDDGTGVLFYSSEDFYLRKWFGTAFDAPSLNPSLEPKFILGHTRYATAGKISQENIHPVQASFKDNKLFLVMNGEISFTSRWRRAQIDIGGSTTDTAACAAYILDLYIKEGDLKGALVEFYKQAFPFGGFTILGLLCNSEEVFFYIRDGMRPLHEGTFQGCQIFSSETKPLAELGADEIRAVPPGEIGIFNGKWEYLNMNRLLQGMASRGECAFEYAYFQEPTSVMHDVSVDSIRVEFGKAACREHPPKNNVIITAVPRSGISATRGYEEEALKSGFNIRLGEILLRRSRGGKRGERSFLGSKLPEITRRLKDKFEINAQEAKDAVIVNVDDSIVRGNVSGWVSMMEREAGAKEVRFISAWPPIVGPCYSGIALSSGDPLPIQLKLEPKKVAENHKILEEKLQEGYEHEAFGKIKFDSIGYLSSKAVIGILKKLIQGDFCTGCFTGCYNYICPVNIKGPYTYKGWLEEFISRNNVEMPHGI